METLYPSSPESNLNWLTRQNKGTTWTREENKKFESALAIFDEKTPQRWDRVAHMTGKSVYDVLNQYMALVSDVNNIEAGLVPVPGYMASSFTLELADNRAFNTYRKRGRSCEHERKKGVPWTEEEHRRFLLGLEKHGKGDWRNISRNYVISKTPTQVASHAQKYYLRQLSGGKDKRRPSIHDITTVHLKDATSSSDEKKSSLVNKSNVLTRMQEAMNTPKVLLDWYRKNEGEIMAFDSGFYDSLAGFPCKTTAPRAHNYVLDVSAPGADFGFCSSFRA